MPQPSGEAFCNSTGAPGAGAPAEVALDAAALARWDRDGVLPVRGLAPTAELAPLRSVVDQVFGAARGRWDFLEPEAEPGEGAEDATQAAWPSARAPWLAGTALRRNAHALASRLLGPEAELVWEAAVLLPPGSAPAQGWRQDESGFTPGTPYREAISIWVPLQEVTEGTGCPRFQRGSHRGPLLPHVRPAQGRGAASWPEVLMPPPPASVVAVPLRAGDAVVHHSRTLHALGANASTQKRRALALDFAVRTPARAASRETAPLMPSPHARRPLGQQLGLRVRRVLGRFF
jgi:hypothetical protein